MAGKLTKWEQDAAAKAEADDAEARAAATAAKIAARDGLPEQIDADEADDADEVRVPALSDPKQAWVDYAEALGIDTEGKTKAKLIDDVYDLQ